MAISMYDQPAQAEFMQTYVPIPFQELMQAGAVQQQRWDESEMLGAELSSEFGNVPFLSHVRTPSGQVLETGNRQLVEQAVGGFRERLDELVRSVPDKASPEYRRNLKQLISDFRGAMSPEGELGRHAADVERYKQHEQEMVKAEIGSSIHRGLGRERELMQYAQATQEGYRPFQVGANFLPDINIRQELQGSLDKVNRLVLQEGFVTLDQLAQIRKTGNTSGIDPNRIVRITSNIINQDPQLRTDLMAQAAAYGDPERSLEENYREVVNDWATTMADMYMEELRSTSWANMPDRLFDDMSGDGIMFHSFANPALVERKVDSIDKEYNNLAGAAEELSNKIERLQGILSSDAALVSHEEGAFPTPRENMERDLATAEANLQELVQNNETLSDLINNFPELSTKEAIEVARNHDRKLAVVHFTSYRFDNPAVRENVINAFKEEEVQEAYSRDVQGWFKRNRAKNEFKNFVENSNNITNVRYNPGAKGFTVSYTDGGDAKNIDLPTYGLPDTVQQNLNTFGELLDSIRTGRSKSGGANVAGMEIIYENRIDPQSKEIVPVIQYKLPNQEGYSTMNSWGELINHALTNAFVSMAYGQRTSERPTPIK